MFIVLKSELLQSLIIDSEIAYPPQFNRAAVETIIAKENAAAALYRLALGRDLVDGDEEEKKWAQDELARLKNEPEITSAAYLEALVVKLIQENLRLRDELRASGGDSTLAAFIAKGAGAKMKDGRDIETFQEVLEPEAGSSPYVVKPKGEMTISFIKAPCRCDIYVAGTWAGGTLDDTEGKFERFDKPILIARSDIVEIVCADSNARIEVVGRRIQTEH